MLDILRKHASSWLIKVILGAIVVSFVFFFGYNSMRKASRIGRAGGSGDAVITVNGIPVSGSEYEFLLDRTTERLRQTFKGDQMPEFVRKMAETTTLQQLVSRELMLGLADELKLTIPDVELADAIRNSPVTRQGGEFDPIFYRHEFLPYFKNRFGLDFESFLLQDLKLGALESTFAKIDDLPPPDKALEDSATWTFEAVVIDPKALVEAQLMKAPDEASSLAKMLIAADPKSWRSMLTAMKISPKKVGPIKIRERATLIDGQATSEDYGRLFALTMDKPVLSEPIERGGKFYVVRLIAAVPPGKDAAPEWPTTDFFRAWMGKSAEKAKIISHLQQDAGGKQ